jgi:ABC-type dipeptide/oligopeptide/nickel transport system permease component
MLRLVATRVAGSAFALIGASLLAFVILRVTPGDPARLILGAFAPEESVARLRETLGVNLPLRDQYLLYLKAFLSGDWGFSYSTGVPVTDELVGRFPATLELGIYAFLFAFAGAVVLALVAAYRRGAVSDGGTRALSLFGLAVPPFWLGLMLMLVFFERLHWLPGPDGRLSLGVDQPPAVTHLYTIDALLAGKFATLADAAAHLVLPVVTLGLMPLSFLLRLLRANLLDVAKESFMTVARSRGLSRWGAFVRHALPNAFLPTLTAAGLLLGQLLSGSVLVEKAFNWPGVGALVTDGVLRQDFSVVQAFILLSAFIYVVANLLVDILAAAIDPRVRHPAGRP